MADTDKVKRWADHEARAGAQRRTASRTPNPRMSPPINYDIFDDCDGGSHEQ